MKQRLGQSSNNSIWATVAKWMLGIIAVLGFGVTIYLGFIKKTAPHLGYEILSETDFYNDSETASYIKIFVDSIDVQENRLNISTYRIRVENKGNSNIGFFDYDTGNFGLQIKNGTILESPVLLDCSTDYIKSKFGEIDSLVSPSFVNIPKLVIDVNDYYDIKLVVLHEAKEKPVFVPEGKIVGQKEIVVSQIQDAQHDFWTIVFSGGFFVYVVRYIIFLLITIFVIWAISTIDTYVDKIKRKQKLRRIIKKLSEDNNSPNVFLEDLKNENFKRIYYLKSLYNMSERELTEQFKFAKDVVEGNILIDLGNEMKGYYLELFEKYKKAIKEGYLITNKKGELKYNIELKKAVEEVVSLLKDNGFIYHDISLLRF